MKKYDSYKDSGIEWIGEIPSHWDFTKLKYVLTIQSGKGITNEEFIENGEFEIYGGNGILGLTNNYSHDGIDLIIGRVGALCGNVRLIKGKKWISDNALVANTSQNYDFIETCLRFLDLNKLANKNAQPLITGTIVKEQYIALPPIQEQTAIANYLDHKTSQIDHLIAKKEQFIKLLEEERVAVINQAVTKGLDPNVPMKDSGVEWLGEIPEHWEVARVKHLSSIISKGTTPSTIGKEVTDEGEIRYIKSENIVDNKILNLPGFYIDNETHQILKRSQLAINDILIVIAGASIGKVAILKDDFYPSNTNQAVSFIRLKNPDSSSFLWYWLQSSYIKERILLDATQSAQPNLSMESIGNFFIPRIDFEEEQKIVKFLTKKTKDIDSIMSKTQQEIELLKEYKTALISEVVTGKVDVSTSSTQV